MEIWRLVTNVPLLPVYQAAICAVVNLLFPGIGTIIAALLSPTHVSKSQIVIGIFQALLSFLLVGFLLSAYWSFLLLTKAISESDKLNAPTPYTNKMQ